MKWNKTTELKPEIGEDVEVSDDGITVDFACIYTDKRTCMMAGIAGGHGYFGEGFATNGEDCDYGLILDDPIFWRYRL